MDNFNSIFSVSRREYKNFVEQIKPECRNIKIEELNKYTIATKIFSTKTNKCLCSRVTYKERVEGEERKPEQYFIFEMPDDDERRPPIPKTRLYLNSKEEVQAFFNFLSKMENKDD